MTIDYQRIYHTGVRVPSLDAAMAELGGPLGLTWAEVRESEQAVWTPDRGQHTVPLRYTYSCEGPQHLELLEGEAGSVWDGREQPGVHHIGVWADDVGAEAAAALAAGWTCAAAQKSPDDGFGVFAYVVPPSGMIVELVQASVRPMFDQWWADGLATAARDAAS
ncbi:MAG: VOC family protein [Ilumatobacter sp.]|jgi:catechol 2,3-dioxygenase-like lactoylglutathione lyase family enzyme|uniref:VOC family protein n=1 Tax=Ilumatobacter sp. TaxID=1967498 RepID=UPI00391D1F28